METQQNENIDVSEWLTVPVHEAYPHRMGKGDLALIDGNIKSLLSLPIIDIMYERRMIDGKQHRTAQFIAMTRMAIANALGMDRVVRDLSLNDDTGRMTTVSPSAMLEIALYGLKAWERNIIIRIGAVERNSEMRDERKLGNSDMAWLSHSIASVRHALDRVQRNIDNHQKMCDGVSTQGTTGVPKIYPTPEMRRGF